MIPAEVQHSYFNFNPRSPCGERHGFPRHPCNRVQFQSTLPVRGATNDLSPEMRTYYISIHAPRAGSDQCGNTEAARYRKFQSTLPVRGATANTHI